MLDIAYVMKPLCAKQRCWGDPAQVPDLQPEGGALAHAAWGALHMGRAALVARAPRMGVSDHVTDSV